MPTRTWGLILATWFMRSMLLPSTCAYPSFHGHCFAQPKGNIPTFIHISDGKLHDANVLDLLIPKHGAFYIMGGAQGSEGAKAPSGVRRPLGRRRAERLVGVRRVSADGDEMPGHATRRQVIAGVQVPRGVRAGTNVGRRRQWPSPHCLRPKSDGPHFGLREKWRHSGIVATWTSSACSRCTEQGVSSSSAPSPLPNTGVATLIPGTNPVVFDAIGPLR